MQLIIIIPNINLTFLTLSMPDTIVTFKRRQINIEILKTEEEKRERIFSPPQKRK